MVNLNNWSHSQYQTGSFKASISIGGEISNDNEYLELFFINKYIDDQIIHQEPKVSLTDAITCINKNYSHWEFNDLSKKEKTSGCSSCQAH